MEDCEDKDKKGNEWTTDDKYRKEEKGKKGNRAGEERETNAFFFFVCVCGAQALYVWVLVL